MHTNHEDVGCTSDFTKEGCTTENINHTTYFWDLVPNNTYFEHQQSTRGVTMLTRGSSCEPNPYPTIPLLEEETQAKRCDNANKYLYTKDKMWRLSKRGSFFNICHYFKMPFLHS